MPEFSDPKKTLKEIIERFKLLQIQLTAEEDSAIGDIASSYLERPISESLVRFGDVLKSLVEHKIEYKTKQH